MIIQTQKISWLAMAALMIFAACSNQETNEVSEEPMGDNVLLKEWTGRYGGVPAFDEMKVEDVKDAILTAIDLKLAEIDVIANNTEAATFANTIEEMERSGAELDRAFTYYGIFSANANSQEFRDIQTELAPIISEYRSKITQNELLFQRIKTVYDASQQTPLEVDQQRVVDLEYKRFEMSGANLDAEKKERFAAINKELSSLYTSFSNNVLHDEEGYVTYLTEDQLGGLAEGFSKSAAKIAADNGHEGEYAITNTRSSMDPFLKYSTERDLRKQVWTNYYARGDNADEYDNNQIIADILRLRRERVELMGYSNYAEWTSLSGDYLSRLSDTEQAAIFGATATRTYRL